TGTWRRRRGIGAIDVDVGAANLVAHGLLAFFDVLADLDFTDHARIPGHHGFLAALTHFEGTFACRTVVGLGCGTVGVATLDVGVLVAQAHRFLRRFLDHPR